MSGYKILKIVKKVFFFLIDSLFPLDKFSTELTTLDLQHWLAEVTKHEQYFDNFIYSFLDYRKEIVEKTIWQMKFNRNADALRLLGEFISQEILKKIDRQPFLIIPVPVFKNKMKSKGFNHTELLVQEILKYDHDKIFTYQKDLIKKVKKTKDQKETKSKKERTENLKNAFQITNPKQIANKNVIIIDDVHTTGATLNEMRKILMKAEAKYVIAFVVAH
ncbi:ComF family protein [Candidatus Nomurabacteria bacterium]|nr:ComF family protein [Candidatus Nomurabacteria bacterium]